MQKYVIISPVRNEEKYIAYTIESVLSQTIRPSGWIIINDGSKDSTKQIVEAYAEQHDWIKFHSLPDRGFYHAGPGVVDAFYKGFELLGADDFDYLVKLDGDLSFEEVYFEQILRRFAENERLGIASGYIVVPSGRRYFKERVQADLPVGASKVYRRACFEAIGGLKRIPGWDTADILSAQMKGWETKCFSDLRLVHYRPTGFQRKGLTKGKFFLGKAQYRFGYSFFYTLLKGLIRLSEKPYVIGGLGIICGHVISMCKRETKYFDEQMIAFLRKKHRAYLLGGVKKAITSALIGRRTDTCV